MQTKEDLEKRLAAAKAKRKPVPTKEQADELAEVKRLEAELATELRALRQEENEAIIAEYAPTKARIFFDLDPELVHPSTVEYAGMTCALYSQFVVRHATSDDLQASEDARKAIIDAHGDPLRVAELAQAADNVVRQTGKKCIVYPVCAPGMSKNQHAMNIEASLWYFGYAAIALGNAASQLGGMGALEHQSKS